MDEIMASMEGPQPKKTARDDYREKFLQGEHPDDFDSADDFLRYVTETIDADLAADKDNRIEALEDIEFAVGNQWDPDTKEEREAAKKPTLTFNRLPAFIGQIIGARRLNETEVKIVADDDAHTEGARLRQGLVGGIQKVSKANRAYNKAFENQVIGGEGTFSIALEYAYDDVFEQDIKVKAQNNPFAVVWDRASKDTTGADARHVTEIDTMSKEEFAREWPNGKAHSIGADGQGLGYDLGTEWITEEEVRVARFWRMRTKRVILALLKDPKDGSEDVVDITDMDPEEYAERLLTNAAGLPIMREADRKYAQLFTVSGADILEGPYDLPISRVPVFRVPGWIINVGNKQYRFGLLRFLKDPSRLNNFWRSVIAEKLMKTPRGNWVATQDAVQGHEAEWRNSHLNDDELLVYDGEGGPAPQRIPPAQIEAALIEQAGMATQDLRDISNLHQASMGQQSNEVSGKAIMARQRVGETGTFIYEDNLSEAIEEAGRVMNELIPYAYDTRRTVKVLGSDGMELSPMVINDETEEKGIDITKGKYSVSSVTGPTSATKRIEAAEGMLNMVNAMPDTIGVAADLIIAAQDWPNAQKIAHRLKSKLPPDMLDESEMTPQEILNKKSTMQQAALEQEKQDMLLASELRLTDAKATQAEALATKAQADAARAMSSIDIDEFKALADVEDTRVQRIMQAVKDFNEMTQTRVMDIGQDTSEPPTT